MPASQSRPIAIPEKSAIGVVDVDTIESAEIIGVLGIWRAHAGEAGVPARDAVLPRPLRSYLRHISLVRWIAEDDDYEFRFFGDAHVQAYDMTRLPGYRLSETIAEAPEFGTALKSSFEFARLRKAPIAFRGTIGRDFPDARFVWFESLYLPLFGESGEIEFVMNASYYTPRNASQWR